MNRVAIVGGCRTPFVRAGGVYQNYNFHDLGRHVVNALIQRLDLKSVDEVIFSSVLLDPRTPNAAREIILRSDLPNSTSAHFISNNCISGLVAVNFAAEGIMSGRIKSALAGGAESMSRPSLSFSYQAEDFFFKLFRSRSISEKLTNLLKFKAKYLFPNTPSPKEPSTGLTMGEHCELIAKEFKIPRILQDEIALKSHLNAARAQKQGAFLEEIVPFGGMQQDNLVRADTSMEKLAKLKSVFDKTEQGTITAGNSSALTDGASVICLMSEQEAKRLNLEILAYVEAVQFSAIEPRDGLLMAPALAVPKILEHTGYKVSDIDVFEIHEAFAAQVAANLSVWEKAWSKYPELKSIGKIPSDKINPNGGSIAIGHPFAATGGRLILSVLNNLRKNNLNRGLISVCAAGAMAAAMIISKD